MTIFTQWGVSVKAGAEMILKEPDPGNAGVGIKRKGDDPTSLVILVTIKIEK